MGISDQSPCGLVTQYIMSWASPNNGPCLSD